MNKILKIINEEIDKVISENMGHLSILLEQDPNALVPPAVQGTPAPPTVPEAPAPPTVPEAPAPPAEQTDKALESLKTKIKASNDDLDIKKRLQAAFQGKAEQKVQEMYSKIISDEELKDKKDAVDKFMKQFYPKIYKKTIKPQVAVAVPPVQVNAIPTIVKESKLQKSIKEYLHYKRLYNQIGDE